MNSTDKWLYCVCSLGLQHLLRLPMSCCLEHEKNYFKPFLVWPYLSVHSGISNTCMWRYFCSEVYTFIVVVYLRLWSVHLYKLKNVPLTGLFNWIAAIIIIVFSIAAVVIVFCFGFLQVTFEIIPKAHMKVVFDRMIQKNKKTGWERRVRCAIKNDHNSGERRYSYRYLFLFISFIYIYYTSPAQLHCHFKV